MSLVSMLKGSGPSGFGYGSTASDVTANLDLSGKTFLLTGCNSGLGVETMRALTKRGARVVAAARTKQKADAAGALVDGDVVGVACELSEPSSVLGCAEQVAALGPLDAIICNAGIMALPELHQKFGYELQFFTNHIGHFLLVTKLIEHLTAEGRVVMVSSNAHFRAYSDAIQFDNLSAEASYTAFGAYGQSKLANLLFARELARRFEGSKRTANALHPGVIHTNLTRHMGKLVSLAMTIGGPLVLKSAAQGAATQTWAAAHPDAAEISGEFLADSNVAKSSAAGRDMAMAAKLWEVSESIVEEVV